MNDGSLDHLNLDSGIHPKFSYSVQASNSYEIGSVFQCPVWVDLGDNNIADIASILLAKGLDSGIPIEIKLRMSLNCLYIPLTIFAISVFLAVIFLGVLCFYTKARTFKVSSRLERNNSDSNQNTRITIPPKTGIAALEGVAGTGGIIGAFGRAKAPVPAPTNFLVTNTETTTSQPKVVKSRGNKTKRKSEGGARTKKEGRGGARAMGELIEEDYCPPQVFQVHNPTIVRHQAAVLPSALCGAQPDPISFI